VWRLAIPLLVGYVITLPVLGWCLDDVKRFRRYEWFGLGKRGRWRGAAIVSYALSGWPVLIVAFVWRTSVVRRAMLEQRGGRRPR
jgi:hypothetical protein